MPAGGRPLVRRVLSGEGEGRPCASLWRVDCLVPLFGVCRTGCPIPLSCEESAGGCFLRRGEGLVCRMPLLYGVGRACRSFFFTAAVPRIAGFPALARNGLPDSFLFQGGAPPQRGDSRDIARGCCSGEAVAACRGLPGQDRR